MDIDNLTIGEIKQINRFVSPRLVEPQWDTGPWVLGEKYIIQTATLYYTGKLTFVGQHELHLDDAALIFDQGRFYDSLKKGTLAEVEPIPDGGVIIGREAIVSAQKWCFDLPRDQK